MYCTSVYEDNNTLTFTASATYFLWSTTQTSPYNPKELFCTNNNYVVLAELRSPVPGSTEYANLLKKHKRFNTVTFYLVNRRNYILIWIAKTHNPDNPILFLSVNSRVAVTDKSNRSFRSPLWESRSASRFFSNSGRF